MAIGTQAKRCANHPERPGHAICMACRNVICQECATQWDGINYCVGCLAGKRSAPTRRRGVLGWLMWLCVVPVLFYAAGRFMVWSLVLTYNMGSGFVTWLREPFL